MESLLTNTAVLSFLMAKKAKPCLCEINLLGKTIKINNKNSKRVNFYVPSYVRCIKSLNCVALLTAASAALDVLAICKEILTISLLFVIDFSHTIGFLVFYIRIFI